MTEPKLQVVNVPVLDTGDQALIEANQARRAKLETLLTPEALALLDDADNEQERRFLFGA